MLNLPQPNLDLLLKFGVVLGENELLPDAEQVFALSAKKFPASFEAAYDLAMAKFALKDFAGALLALDGVPVTSARQKAACQYLKGKIYSSTGRLSEAEKNLDSAFRADPEQENYALDLGMLYIRSQAYVPAIDALQKAAGYHPQSVLLRVELALAEVLAGRRNDALALCNTLLRSHPELAMARLIESFGECLDGNYKGCEMDASAGLALRNPHPYFYYLHAKALWQSGSSDYQRMLADLDTASARLNGCSVCFLLRSKVYEKLSNSKAAVADLKKVTELDPGLAAAWYRLAVVLRRSGQPHEAADALRRYRGVRASASDQEIENFERQLVGASSTASPQ